MQFHDRVVAWNDISHDLSTLPGGDTGARIMSLLTAINANNRARMMEFVAANLALPSSTPAEINDCVEWMLWFYRGTQGVVLCGIEPANCQTSHLVLIVEDRLYSARHRLRLHFDGDGLGPIIAIGAGPADAGDNGAMTRNDYARLAGTLCERGFEAAVFSGAVLVASGDDVLFESAYGESNKRCRTLNNIETKFNLGSANKMFTAVAVAQLVEQGRLGFADTIERYVDETWLPASVTSGITVHHLLSHTSGLGSYFNDAFFNGSRALYREIDDFKPLVKDDRPAFKPGERFEYSNTGMLLAGVVVESVTGSSYFDHIRSAIYEPSGMINTESYDIDAPIENLAMGYILAPKTSRKSLAFPSNPMWRENIFEHVAKGGPAGGGYSTVRDLHRFSRALLSGKLIGADTRRLLWTDHSGAGYGYGFNIEQTQSGMTVGHSGGFLGVSASFTIHLDSDHVVIVLSNYDGGTFGLSQCLEDMTARLRG